MNSVGTTSRRYEVVLTTEGQRGALYASTLCATGKLRFVRRRIVIDLFALEDWCFRLALRVDLSRFGLGVQAAVFYCVLFDPFAFEQ